MFGGMMDPEMMRIAQEQMNRMRPEDLQRMQQQMFSNPDLLRMASEGMKNMRPEDLRMAAEQMKNIPSEQMADISARMANASPEEIASMRARNDGHRSVEYQNLALSLKTQGNQLHGIGKYTEAAEKYLRAKDNLNGISTPDANGLRLTCSLNLMSCYLKMKKFNEVLAEGTEVLKGDSRNLKALYRRGQAYKEIGHLKLSVSDLKTAAEISPEDETIAATLRQVREEMKLQTGYEEVEENGIQEGPSSNGPIIEEIPVEEADRILSGRRQDSSAQLPSNASVITDDGEQSSTTDGRPTGQDTYNRLGDGLEALAQNPEMIRSMHTMMSNMNPEHIAAMSGGKMTPHMAKMASDMVKNMSPDALENIVGIASQIQGDDGTFSPAQSSSSRLEPPFSSTGPPVQVENGPMGLSRRLEPEAQRIGRLGTNSGEGMPSMADFSPEMQEQLRKQMNDPAMKQMMADMVKNMSPETMASMSENLGMKLSPEEAAQAQKVMANLSPDDLDRIMRWADRAQRVAGQARQAKNWLLGRPGLILALVMLILAVLLHHLGYIG